MEREWFEGGMKWEVGVNKCKPLSIEWKNNGSYCIAEYYTWYAMVNYNEKEY